MKIVYLVIKITECGFRSEEKPFKVYMSKRKAEEVAKANYGYVEEIEFYDD